MKVKSVVEFEYISNSFQIVIYKRQKSSILLRHNSREPVIRDRIYIKSIEGLIIIRS